MRDILEDKRGTKIGKIGNIWTGKGVVNWICDTSGFLGRFHHWRPLRHCPLPRNTATQPLACFFYFFSWACMQKGISSSCSAQQEWNLQGCFRWNNTDVQKRGIRYRCLEKFDYPFAVPWNLVTIPTLLCLQTMNFRSRSDELSEWINPFLEYSPYKLFTTRTSFNAVLFQQVLYLALGQGVGTE